MRAAGVLLLLLTAAAAEVVRFKTPDGVEIVADYYAGKKNAASVICIPMFRHARASYRPLLFPLSEKGLHVLVIDPRGHGDSAPELRGKVAARDAALFNAMHRDVEAAIRFLERDKGCDPTRIGLCGASVGCSVAIDTAIRHPEAVRAVVLLTPGSDYLQVPTLKHLENWPGTAVFTFTSTEEEQTSAAVIAALKPFDGSNHFVVPGRGIHGTRMFGQVPAVEQTVASFLDSRLSRSADLRVPCWDEGPELPEGADPRPVRLRRGPFALRAHAVGTRWWLVAAVDGAFDGAVTFLVDGQRVRFPVGPRAPDGPVRAGAAVAERVTAEKSRHIRFSPPGLGRDARLAVEFRSSRGKRVRIPAQGDFAARLQPVRRR